MRTIFLSLCAVLAIGPAALAQSSDVQAPPDSVVAEGVPRIPASLAEKANRYTEFRSALLLDWHPQRREMLIATRFADTNQVHEVKMPGGARTQLTFFPDRVGGAAYQRRRGEYFVFSKDRGGSEFFQFYRFDPTTGDSMLLTDGKSRNTGIVWAHSGKRIAYGSTRRNGKDVDIYVMDPADRPTDKLLIQNEGGGWAAAEWSRDDNALLLHESLSINESYLWLADPETGKKTLLTPKDENEKIAYEPIGFSADRSAVYAITDRGSEFMRLARIDLASKKHTFLTPNLGWDVEHARLSENGRFLAFVVNENGASVLHLWDTAASQEKPLPKLPLGVIEHLVWHENNRELGLTLSSARSPADAYSVDVESGRLDRWTRSETGGLNTDNFSQPELVRFSSFDGREISAFYYQPPPNFTGKRPVIINIHGGPEGQARPIFLARNNYYLNEMGVAIIFPNVRGSSGYGKSFLKLDNGSLREDTYKDIGALLDWIKSREDLDSERVMVTGGSYGGHMTLAVATRYSHRISCALDVVGISNLVTFLERTEAYRRDLRRVEYGDERDAKMREFLERIAPLNHADEIKKPLFVVQGKNDPRVPLQESEQMIQVVRKQGTPVWYLMAQDEGHGFAKKKNADFQFYATIAFIQKYLLPDSNQPAAAR